MEALQAVLERMAGQLEQQHSQAQERMQAFEQLMLDQARVTNDRVNNLQAVLEQAAANALQREAPGPAGAAGPPTAGPAHSGFAQSHPTSPTAAAAATSATPAAAASAAPNAFQSSTFHFPRTDATEQQRMKQILTGITRIDELDKWSQFAGEVRLMLDGYHPSIGAVLRAVAALDKPPDNLWIVQLSQDNRVPLEDL